MAKVKFTIITLFEDALRPYLETSMMWKATKNGIAEFDFVNLREFGLGPHRSVDDTPYGGGDGMLLRCEPVFAAIESVKEKDPNAKVILPTPAGQIWNQELAREFAGVAKPDMSADELERSITKKSEGIILTSTSSSEARSDILSSQVSAATPRRDSGSSSEEQNVEIIPEKHFIILCPHYEGYDERILTIVDYPICLGQYVLTGGELPA